MFELALPNPRHVTLQSAEEEESAALYTNQFNLAPMCLNKESTTPFKMRTYLSLCTLD